MSIFSTIFGKKTPATTEQQPAEKEGAAARTSRRIAYSLMSAYGVCLIVILIFAIVFYNYKTIGDKPDDRWLLVFKDGFAFLGGLLATIVGYYFGNKNVGDALEKAKDATDKFKVASEVAKDATEKAKEATELADAKTATTASIKAEFKNLNRASDPVETETLPVKDADGELDPIPASGTGQ